MFSKISEKFKNDPSVYYAFSIAATWAGVNSLMGGIEMAHKYGIWPYMLWATGNVLACIVFGVLAPMIPKLRDVFRSRVMKLACGLLCPFQVWLSMNGIQSVFADTPLGPIFGRIAVYAIAIAYIVMLWRRGMIRNVLTDHISWVAVYVLIYILTAVAFGAHGLEPLDMGLDKTNLMVGLQKCILLIPGPFLYPYYFELLDYNERNVDGTKMVDIRRAFINSGWLFAGYLFFAFALAFTSFGPVTSIIKAVLITLVAVSSLSSFQYSIYITFGKRMGLSVNIATVLFWPLVVSMGVMGVWTLMSTIRIYIVLGGIVAALVWYRLDKRKAVQV